MQICTNTSRRKNLPIVSLGSGIWRALCFSFNCFLWNRYHCPLVNGFSHYAKGMEYEDQRCLGLFFLVRKNIGRSSWRTTMQPHKLINKEQLLLSTHATSQSRAAQMNSQLGDCKGVTIDWSTTIFHACGLRSCGPQSHHPCHWQIKSIISHHHECFPQFGSIFVLDRVIFQRPQLHA